jgi:phospholipase/carboxylesterase
MSRVPTSLSCEPHRGSLDKAALWARELPGSSPLLPRYSLFGPLHYERSYAYPLVVWLHGPRDNEHQLRRVMPHISLRNYAAIGPRGTEAQAAGVPGFHWGLSAESLAVAERSVMECVEVAKQRFHVDPQRVFLAGFECGASAAYYIGLRNPEQFAGVAAFNGPFPHGQPVLADLPRARRMPLFVAHGRDSNQYPIAGLCDDLRLFHAAGLSANVRQYPCGDELTTKMLEDLDAWIMELVTGQAAAAAELQAAQKRN